MSMLLKPELLCAAYAQGYFPMPDPETEEILWYRPDPRAILPLNHFHCSHTLKRTIRQGIFQVTFDKAFSDVIRGCADREDTWINEEMREAYERMFAVGLGHSVEVWQREKLVGGLYGISLGGAFFGESQFSRARDASKVATFHLGEHLKAKGFLLHECQFMTPHLKSLGAVEIADGEYQKLLRKAVSLEVRF
jgi:leucyl/phenylalanyl-tRNA---protein transferase